MENGIALPGAKMAYVGEGKANVVTSLMVAAAKLGRRVARGDAQRPPSGAEPGRPACSAGATTTAPTSSSPPTCAKDCWAPTRVYADMWVPLEGDWDIGRMARDFRGYQIDREAMAMTENPRAIFLHCMPAQHNVDTAFGTPASDAIETTDEVFDGPLSRGHRPGREPHAHDQGADGFDGCSGRESSPVAAELARPSASVCAITCGRPSTGNGRDGRGAARLWAEEANRPSTAPAMVSPEKVSPSWPGTGWPTLSCCSASLSATRVCTGYDGEKAAYTAGWAQAALD